MFKRLYLSLKKKLKQILIALGIIGVVSISLLGAGEEFVGENNLLNSDTNFTRNEVRYSWKAERITGRNIVSPHAEQIRENVLAIYSGHPQFYKEGINWHQVEYATTSLIKWENHLRNKNLQEEHLAEVVQTEAGKIPEVTKKAVENMFKKKNFLIKLRERFFK